MQDHTIGAIYDTIREINERVAAYASEVLAEAAKRGERSQHGAKTRSRAAGRA